MCPTPRERTVAKQTKAAATSAPAGPQVSTTNPAKGKVGNVNYGFASNGAKGSGPSFNPIGFLELPLFIVLAGALRHEFRWSLMGPMFALYLWKECVPMSVCLHRYFSHKGFRCGRVAQFALHWMGCLASQGPPLWWASKHRRHHAHCDTENDPHSPVTLGKLYAWLGWAYLSDDQAQGPFGKGHDKDWMQDHLRFPELVLMENLYFVPIAVAHAAFYAYGGVKWCVFVSMMSGVLCQLLTMYFNVVFHSFEPKAPAPGVSIVADDASAGRDEKKKAGGGGAGFPGGGVCRAVDLPFDPLSNIFGEAHHAWHHKHPLAFKRPGLDLPYWLFIKPLLAVGVFSGENKMAAANVK